MSDVPSDIYTEPRDIDVDTLACLGPLRGMAGVWQGLDTFGICSAPFLDQAFKTLSFRIRVSIHPDGGWSYEEDTVLQIRGLAEPFHHTDRNTLTRVGEPTHNPLAR